MTDMIHIIPHPDEESPLAQLRSEFRASNRERIHDALLTHPCGWGVLGDPSKSRACFSAEEWSFEMLFHLDDAVTQDFGLSAVPSALGARIEKLAGDSVYHDLVSHPGGVEHDSAPCDIAAMTDDEICDYVDQSIKESDRG